MSPPSVMPATEATRLTLRIKLSIGVLEGKEELAIPDVDRRETIGWLRSTLQSRLPAHPPPERQRLLFSGHALIDNGRTIGDALHCARLPEQTDYVLHLVIRPDPNAPPAAVGRALPRPASVPGSQMPGPPGPPGPPEPPQLHPADLLQQQQNVLLRQQQMMAQLDQQQQLHRQPGHMAPPYPQFAPGPMPPGFHMTGQMLPPGFNMAGQAMPMMPPGFNMTGQAMQMHQHGHQMPGMPMGGPMGTPPMQQHNPTVEPGHANVAQAQANGSPARQADQAAIQQHAQPSGEAPPSTNEPPPATPPSRHQPAADQPGGVPTQAQPQHQQQHHQHLHPPRRPVSGQGFVMQGIGPNGEHITINHQTMHFPPPNGVPGQPSPQLPQPFIPGFQMPGANMQLPPQIGRFPGNTNSNGSGPTALNRAREDMAEMHRLLDELRDPNHATALDAARLNDLQQRAVVLNDYIDPFRALNTTNNGNANDGRRSTSARPPSTPQHAFRQRQDPARYMHTMQPVQPAQLPMANSTVPSQIPGVLASPNEVTCYLLSSPAGPHALLFHPQHGTYTSGLSHHAATPVYPTRPRPTQPETRLTAATPPAQVAQNNNNNNGGPHPPAAQPQPPAAQPQDPLAPLQPILNHLWTLFRVLIFLYFMLGAGLGWRRPAILLAVGAVFMLLRLGAVPQTLQQQLRAWWEGVVGVHPPPVRLLAQGGAGQDAAAAGQDAAADAHGRPPGHMPTPAQLAHRVVEEQRARRRSWLRERVRPVERAAALFIASLWPGIGEAHVRARREEEEEEERRRVEEEGAARRAVEEEEEEERRKAGAGERGVAEGEEEQRKAEAGKQGEQSNAEGIASASAQTPGPAAAGRDGGSEREIVAATPPTAGAGT